MRKSISPYLLACVCLSMGLSRAEAQEAFSSIGGDATGSTGSEAFSVGLVVYTELSGPGGSMSQGIQHPYEVFPVSASELNDEFQATVYPNPVDGILTIETATPVTNASFLLFDAKGKELMQHSLDTHQTRSDLTQLPAGVYMLRLEQEGKPIRSFTIVKH